MGEKIEQFAATGCEPADAALQAVLDMRTTVADLQAGVGSVAEVLGLSKGIDEGLNRFGESVKSLKAEQDMHPELAHLQLQAPAAALQFHEVWDALLPVVVDEDAGAQHPADFGAKLKAVLGDRLTDAQVNGMFEALSASLKEATEAQWK